MTDLFGEPALFLQRLLLQLPALLVAVTVHELAHALVADRLGDPTARRLGRITLNPLPHIDPIGALCLVLAGFGWAKPVPVDARNFRHPVRDMFWVAVAGPIANFVAAFAAIVLYLALRPSGLLPGPVLTALGAVFVLNLALGIFNLIPLPPLDGGHFLPYLLPAGAAGLLRILERYGMLILLLLVFTGATRRIVRPVTDWAAQFMIALARIVF
jgi:Zn-dependent protease